MLRRLGFQEKWVRWMRECLRSCSISVLVNENPTKEFNIHRKLRQRDPLTPFLFKMVAEGLSEMMRMTTLKNIFKGYMCGNVEVNLLQYADDTIFIAQVSIQNVEVNKSMLRCSELA